MTCSTKLKSVAAAAALDLGYYIFLYRKLAASYLDFYLGLFRWPIVNSVIRTWFSPLHNGFFCRVSVQMPPEVSQFDHEELRLLEVAWLRVGNLSWNGALGPAVQMLWVPFGSRVRRFEIAATNRNGQAALWLLRPVVLLILPLEHRNGYTGSSDPQLGLQAAKGESKANTGHCLNAWSNSRNRNYLFIY